MQLPGPLSGMSLTLPEVCADAAFVATWTATADKVMVICSELGRSVRGRVDEQAYKQALDRLRQRGVNVSRSGEVSFTEAATRAFEGGPWRKDTTTEELLGFLPRSTQFNMGQGSRMHARIMRCIHALPGNADL